MKSIGSEIDLLMSKMFRKVVLLVPSCRLPATISIIGGPMLHKSGPEVQVEIRR
jgi:hypothetical protein